METIDTLLLVSNCLKGLMQKYRQEPVSNGVQAIMAAITEGLSFPTSLDRRCPNSGGHDARERAEHRFQRSQAGLGSGPCDSNAASDESGCCIASRRIKLHKTWPCMQGQTA